MSEKVITLDLNFQGIPETIASYLIVGPDGPVLIETGPGSTLEMLIQRLDEHGFASSDIKHVLVTHIHLDHAGAAGWWAQQGAQVYVHHVGAQHLINPSKLLASAGRIYGDQMETLWGETVPAPVENVTAVEDNDTIAVAGLTFTALDTPGHAWHHHTYRLGNIAFTGDAAGIRLAQKPLVDIPAPPPEFKLEVWHKTLDRLASEQFAAIYPTHFDRVDDVSTHLREFRALLDDAANFVRQGMENGVERDALVTQFESWHRERARQAGVSEDVVHQYETANPWYMSVDGIMRYWRKKMGDR